MLRKVLPKLIKENNFVHTDFEFFLIMFSDRSKIPIPQSMWELTSFKFKFNFIFKNLVYLKRKRNRSCCIDKWRNIEKKQHLKFDSFNWSNKSKIIIYF